MPNVCETNSCCSIQFLLQKLQTLSVLFSPSELPKLLTSPKSPIIAHQKKDIFPRLHIKCKCTFSHSCHMGFNLGGHHDCVSRKEYASLLHRVEVLEKALQHQITQGHNPLLSSHGSHDSPSDVVVEDNKANNSVLGSVPECSHKHSHSPSIDPVSMAMAQGDSGHQSPVDNVSISTELGSLATVLEPGREVLRGQTQCRSVQQDQHTQVPKGIYCPY